MYDVNVQRIDAILLQQRQVYSAMSRLTEAGQAALREDPIHFYAGQRLLQLAIESITDIGSLLIDGFIMRDPGSYQDIIEILMDERVVSGEYGDRLIGLVNLRNWITKEYLHIGKDRLFEELSCYTEDVGRFEPCIRAYLQKELGVHPLA